METVLINHRRRRRLLQREERSFTCFIQSAVRAPPPKLQVFVLNHHPPGMRQEAGGGLAQGIIGHRSMNLCRLTVLGNRVRSRLLLKQRVSPCVDERCVKQAESR